MIEEFGTVASALARRAAHHPDRVEPDRAAGGTRTSAPRPTGSGTSANAVRFADSVRFAHAAGATRFLEVGPSSA